MHVTVSAVTDQGIKGNLGEKVSAGFQPACAELRLSLTVGGCVDAGGGDEPNLLHKVCRYRDLYQEGFELYFERPWGSYSEDVPHNAWITCVYSWSALKF